MDLQQIQTSSDRLPRKSSDLGVLKPVFLLNSRVKEAQKLVLSTTVSIDPDFSNKVRNSMPSNSF